MQVRFDLDADSPLVGGVYEDGVLSGGLSGFRVVNFGGSPPDVRRLTTVLDAGAQDGVDYPAGFGWARGSVNRSGAVNLRGQLGDAQALAVTARLSATGQALIWSQPYREKTVSFIGGVIAMPNVGQPIAVGAGLEEGLSWFKAAKQSEKSYTESIAEDLTVDATSSGSVPVRAAAELAGVLGLVDSKISVEIEGGGVSNAVGATPVLLDQFVLAPNFGLLSDTPGAAVWSGKVARNDGGFAGRITLPEGASNLAGRALVNGVLLTAPTGSSQVIGAGLMRVPVAGVRGAFRTAAVLLEP